eukprot:694778-Prymnesium_polylepis.1
MRQGNASDSSHAPDGGGGTSGDDAKEDEEVARQLKQQWLGERKREWASALAARQSVDKSDTKPMPLNLQVCGRARARGKPVP